MRQVMSAICASLLTLTGLSACSQASAPNATQDPSSGSVTANSASPSTSTQASAASSKGPDVEVCSLVTRAEAETYLGELVDAPKPVLRSNNQLACQYGPTGIGTTAQTQVYGQGYWGLQRQIDADKTLIPFAGLGDEAYYILKDATTDLWVRQGRWVLNLTSSPP